MKKKLKTKTKKKTKRNPTDATMRNIRALKNRVDMLVTHIEVLQLRVFGLEGKMRDLRRSDQTVIRLDFMTKNDYEMDAKVEINLRNAIFKLKQALNNKKISGLLITEAEVASILLALGRFAEEESND